MCRVSATRRIIVSTLPSRCLSENRRRRAWMSRNRVSASTATAQPGPVTTASQARRSPGIERGTSGRQPRPAGSSVRNRASSPSCAASRTRSPFGYARSGMSSPRTTPSRTSVSYRTLRTLPRSIRLTWECETPTSCPRSRCASPAWSRASRNSSPTPVSARWINRWARSSRRSRVAIDAGCQPALHCGSPASWCPPGAHGAARQRWAARSHPNSPGRCSWDTERADPGSMGSKRARCVLPRHQGGVGGGEPRAPQTTVVNSQRKVHLGVADPSCIIRR